MGLIKWVYKLRHPGVSEDKIPVRYKISLWAAFWKPIRKWFSAAVIPTIPFNGIRVICYRLAGFKIGEGTFIGMRCYLDDMCFDKIEIGKNVTISYGVYFACHGRKQGHNRIVIKDGAYIGMRASIIAPKGDVEIGEKAIVGTMTLVNKSIPAGMTAVGVPCRILEKRVQGPDVQDIDKDKGNV